MAFFNRSASDRKAEAARHREITEEMKDALRTNIPAIVRFQLEKNRAKKAVPNTMTSTSPAIPVVPLELCEYDKTRKVLKLASNYFGMPKTFFVVSHHTGKEVRFVTVGPEDKLFDQDQWDGEMQVYRPLGDVPGVDHMVIYQQW